MMHEEKQGAVRLLFFSWVNQSSEICLYYLFMSALGPLEDCSLFSATLLNFLEKVYQNQRDASISSNTSTTCANLISETGAML